MEKQAAPGAPKVAALRRAVPESDRQGSLVTMASVPSVSVTSPGLTSVVFALPPGEHPENVRFVCVWIAEGNIVYGPLFPLPSRHRSKRWVILAFQ